MTAGEIIAAFADRSLSVAILIAIVLVIRRPFARAFGPQAAYLLWAAPVVRLVMPTLNVLPRPEETLAAAPLLVMRYVTAAPESVTATLPTITDPVVNNDIGAFAMATALMLWLLVTLAIIGYGADEFWRQRSARLQRSQPVSPALAAMARKIARSFGLKRAPRLRLCDDDSGPFVAGLFKPVIFLPRNFESDFSLQQQSFILTHEIAHVARGDLIALGGAHVMRALQWPNPLAHLALGAFRVDQEAACDATVLRRFNSGDSRSSYLETILHSVRAGRAEPAHGLSFNHPLKERLMYLKSTPPGKLRAFGGAALSIALVAGGLLATADYGYAAEKRAVRAGDYTAPVAPAAPAAETATRVKPAIAPAVMVSPAAPSEPTVLVAPDNGAVLVAPSAPSVKASAAFAPKPVTLAMHSVPAAAAAPSAPSDIEELDGAEKLDGAYVFEFDAEDFDIDEVEGLDSVWEFSALKDGFAFKDFEEAFNAAFDAKNFQVEAPDFDFEFFSDDDGDGYAIITGDIDEDGKRTRILSFRGNLADIEKCLKESNDDAGKKSSKKRNKNADDDDIVCINGIHKYQLKTERDALGQALENMRMTFNDNEEYQRESIARHFERARENLRAQQARLEERLQRLEEQQARAEEDHDRAMKGLEANRERVEREREQAEARMERDRERAERDRERAEARAERAREQAEREREAAMDRAIERAERERDDD